MWGGTKPPASVRNWPKYESTLSRLDWKHFVRELKHKNEESEAR